MKQSKSKKKQVITVNQEELLFPDLKFLSPLCLKILLLWKAEQLFDLALRMSELSSALKRYGDFPDDEESHLFYSKLDRSIKNEFVDFTLAACVEFKIITMGELETFALAGHTDINITTLQKSFEFARGVLKIKINEPHSLVMLASACSVLSSVYRLNKESMQENILKTFIAIEHRLTNKACEAIGYWTKKLEEIKAGKKGGEKPKKNQPILLAVTEYLREHPNLVNESNENIARRFKRNVKGDESIIVDFDGCKWDVYFVDKKIKAIANTENSNKHSDKSIAYSTFRNNYIRDAKKIIKETQVP